MDFLSVYSLVHRHAFPAANISSGFRATGLIPLDPEKVISKLVIKLKDLKDANTTYFIKQQPVTVLRNELTLQAVPNPGDFT
jgi:hypothetical protein